MKGLLRGVRGAILFLLVGGGTYPSAYASEAFTFDSLYPKNNYRKATEQCIAVWGAFDALLNQEGIESIALTQLIERSLGQLLIAQRLLAIPSKDGSKPSAEQMHYLSRVIGTIADRSERLPALNKDYKTCLHESIAQLRKTVEDFLSK